MAKSLCYSLLLSLTGVLPVSWGAVSSALAEPQPSPVRLPIASLPIAHSPTAATVSTAPLAFSGSQSSKAQILQAEAPAVPSVPISPSTVRWELSAEQTPQAAPLPSPKGAPPRPDQPTPSRPSNSPGSAPAPTPSSRGESPALPPKVNLPTSPPVDTPADTSSPPSSPNPSSPASTTSTPPPTNPDSPTQTDAEPIEPIKTAAEVERYKQLSEADRLYQAGQQAEAEKIYRTIKLPFAQTVESPPPPAPISDPEALSPGGQVFWRESMIGLEQNLPTRIFVPLQLLTEKHPQFVPGHLRLAQAWADSGKPDQSLAVLEKATALYPHQPDLLKAKLTALEQQEKWMDAAITARQFALLNPDHPQAAEFTALADRNQSQAQRQLRRKLNSKLVGGILTGALSYALTGSLYGPLNAVQATALMLGGESTVGNRITKQAKRQLKLVDDPELVGYVDELGQKLAKVSGRNEFKYEFFVVLDDELNAFALPGGKVFINLGAIAKTNSEAELAGLLAHELSHTVLSHGFQLMTEGTLTANVTQVIPYVGGIAGQLLVLNYSRDMERQADTLGTRILASSGYAADGLRNLMVTLQHQETKQDRPRPPAWASSHPTTTQRIQSLEQLITQAGYNRYAYEGVERHGKMQAKANQLIKQHRAETEAKRKQK